MCDFTFKFTFLYRRVQNRMIEVAEYGSMPIPNLTTETKSVAIIATTFRSLSLIIFRLIQFSAILPTKKRSHD